MENQKKSVARPVQLENRSPVLLDGGGGKSMYFIF